MASVLTLLPAPTAVAATGINKTINFQGKVTNSDGTNVANNTYTFVFRIYTAATGNASGSCTGVCVWTETKTLTVTDGVFQTNLGSVTSLPGSVNFNDDGIYLGMSFNADPEMSPRIQFTASPYAFNSDALQGLHAADFGQLQTGSPTAQTGTLDVTGNLIAGTSVQAPLVDTATAVALNVGTGTASSVTIGRTTTPFLVQGNSTSTFTATSGANKTTVGFVTPTSNHAINFPDFGGTICTDVAATCSATYQVASATGYLAKDVADTSTFAVTTANYLYGFTNSNGTPTAGGVLKLDNSANTGDTLLVTASGTPGASKALIVVNNTAGTGNLIDLQAAGASKLAVDTTGTVTQASGATVNGQTITSTANFTGTVTVATSVIAPLLKTADVTGASANLTVRTGNSSTSGVSGDLTLASGTTASGNSGAVSLDSGVATGGTAGGVSVGAGAFAHATTVGSTSGSSALTLQAGTGNLNITTQGTGQLNIANNAVAQTVNLGNSTGGTAVTIASGTGNLSLTTQGTGQLNIGNNAVAQTINVGNSTGATSVNIACGTGATACQLGTNAIAHTTIVGTTTGAGATTIQSGTGNLSITTQGTGTLGVGNNAVAQIIAIGNATGATSVTVASGTGNLQLTTQGTGTLGVGNNAVAQNIAIGNSTGATNVTVASGTGNLSLTTQGTGTLGVGNNAVAQTIAVGNSTGATAVTIAAGTGNLSLTTQGTGQLNIGNNAVAQTINVGNSTGATSVNIACGTGTTACQLGTNAIAHTTIVGTTTGAGATTIQAGTGNLTITTLGTGTLGVGNNAVAQTIAVGNSTGATSVSIASGTGNLQLTTQGTGTLGVGNNAVAQTIAIGNATGATAVTIASGTGNLQLTTQGTGTLGIGNNAVAQTVAIGNSTGATTVAIDCGTGACNFGATATAHTTTVGSATGASVLNLNGGTGGVSLGNNGVANTLQIGNTTGAVVQTINLGNNATASSVTNVNIGSVIGASTTTVQGGVNSTFAVTNATGSTVLGFAAPSTAGTVTYQLPAGGTGGTTYGICTTFVVCAGYATTPASGNYLVQVPTSNTAGAAGANVIAPTAASIVGLTVKGTTNGTTGNVLEIFNANASPTRQAFFDATGSLNVAQVIQPTSNNAVDLGIASTGTFRSGFFGTSVVSPSFTGAGAVSVTSGGANALTLDTGGAAAINIGAASPAANAINLNQNTTVAGAKTFTVGTGLTTLGGGITETGTASINGTGAAATTIGNSSAGAVQLASGTASSFAVTGSTLALSGSNFSLNTSGVLSLLGAQTNGDIVTPGATTATALKLQPGTSSAASTTGAALNLVGGDATGTTSVTAGAVNIQGGNATGASGTRNGGSVSIDAGTGGAPGVNGTVTIGGTNATAVSLGHTGITTTNVGALTVTQLLTANGNETINGTLSVAAANTSGNSVNIANTSLGTNGANLANLTFTNTNTTTSFIGVSGVSITPTGTSNTNAGVNELYAINLPNVTPVLNNNFTALKVGSGYNNTLMVNGTAILNGSGVLQTAALTGTYSNALTFNNAANVYNGSTYTGTTFNGLTLTAAADGFNILGGTAARRLTVTGADITVGSTIQPTSAGALAVKSNGTNALTLDAGTAGGGASVSIGNAAAGAITIGNVTTNPTVAFNGSGTFGTTTGAVSLNGNTSVTGSATFGVAAGLTTLGGGLAVTSTGIANNGFGITGAGAVAGATTISANNKISTTGGTYIGINAPLNGGGAAGSTADFVNFENNGTPQFTVSAAGLVSAATGYSAAGAAGSTIAACTAGQYIGSLATTGGLVTAGSCAAIPGVNSFVQGGNSFTADAVLGTIDNFDLQILVHNANTWTFTKTGDLKIVSTTGGFDQSASTTGTFKTGGGAVSLNGDTTVANGKNFTVGSGNLSVTSAATTANAASVTVNTLTTGSAFKVIATNTNTTNASVSAVALSVTNAQATTAVNGGNQIAGLNLQYTQAPTVAGNNEMVANFAVVANAGTPTDSTVASILNLANNDTATGNQIKVTSAINIEGANTVNGINFNGTFDTNLISTSTNNYTLTQAGDETAKGNTTLGTAGTTSFKNNGSTAYATCAYSIAGTGTTALSTAAKTPDVCTAFVITNTFTPVTITVPAPAAGAGAIVYVSNLSTSTSGFTLLGSTMGVGSSATLVYTGAGGWTYAGADGNSILNQTGTNQAANFQIQTNIAGGVATSAATAIIKAAATQTGDLLQFQPSGSTTPIAKIDVNGNLTAVGGTFTGNVAVGTVGTSQFTNNGSTLNAALALGDLATGTMGASAAATVDIYTAFTISPTASGRSYTVFSPAGGAAGRVIYVSNINATNSFTLSGASGGSSVLMNPGVTSTLVWNGTIWTFAGTDSSGLQAAYNNSGATNPQIQLNSTNGGLKVDDAGSTVGTLFSVNNSGHTVSYLAVTATATTLTGNLLFTSATAATTRTIQPVDQTTTATAGNNLTVRAAAGNTSGVGGDLALAAGAGGNTAQGGNASLTGGAAGGSNTNGGLVTVQGGAAAGTGTGGTATVAGGAASATAGSIGGAVAVTGQNGAAGLSAVSGGAGGAVGITSGTGGAGTVTNSSGGNGANVTITAGSGGASTGAGTNGNGGNIRLIAGNAGGTANGTPGVVEIDTPVFTATSETVSSSSYTVVQADIDGFSTIVLTDTSFTNATVTVPAPRNATAGRIIYITSSNSSVAFTLAPSGGPTVNMLANDTAMLVWNGAQWTASASSSSLQQVYNNTSSSPASIVTTSTAKTLTVQAGATFDSTSLLQVSNSNSNPVFTVDSTTTNMLVNSGFETGNTSWAGKGGTLPTVTNDGTAGNFYHGTKSIKAVTTVATSGVATSGGQAAFTANITATTQYQFTFYAKCSGSIATLTIGRQDVSGTDVNVVTNGACTTQWQQFTAHWTTGGTITNPNVYVTLGTTASGSLWVDAASLVQTNTSAATPYRTGAVDLGGVMTEPAVFVNNSDSTTAFQIMNAAGTSLFNVDTANAAIRIGDTTNNVSFTAGTREPVLNGTARHTEAIRMTAEYAGAVLDSNGASTVTGTMTAAFDSTNRHSYYKWTTSQAVAQTYDIVAQIPIPDDWVAWNGNPTFMSNLGTVIAGDSLTATITRSDGTTDATFGTKTISAGSTGWSTYSSTGLDAANYTAGGVMTVRIHMSAINNNNVQMGDITLPYFSKY